MSKFLAFKNNNSESFKTHKWLIWRKSSKARFEINRTRPETVRTFFPDFPFLSFSFSVDKFFKICHFYFNNFNYWDYVWINLGENNLKSGTSWELSLEILNQNILCTPKKFYKFSRLKFICELHLINTKTWNIFWNIWRTIRSILHVFTIKKK